MKQFRTIIESLIDLTQSVNTFNSMSPAPNSNSSTQDGSEYYEEVESAYLKELECFYAVESKAFLDTENGTEDYVLKVQSWMESEEQRTSQLMHSTTFPKVVHILNDILVVSFPKQLTKIDLFDEGFFNSGTSLAHFCRSLRTFYQATPGMSLSLFLRNSASFGNPCQELMKNWTL